MKINDISENVIRRLPRYLRMLDALLEQGRPRVSSADLGEMLGFTPSQVRQDFNTFGSFGQQGYGYSVLELRSGIASILGIDGERNAIMIGAGHIGLALMENLNFEQYGVHLTAAFEVDPDKIGKEINGIPVYSASSLEQYLVENKVDIAVLTVPKHIAREAAERIQKCNVNVFWNFTNVDLAEPGTDVIFENIHFSDSLSTLCYYITAKRERETFTEK